LFPVGIGLRDPRSQKRDLGHPSVSPFDFAEGTIFVISLPTRFSESAARDDKGMGGLGERSVAGIQGLETVKAIVGLRPSFSSHVRFGEREAPRPISEDGSSRNFCRVRLDVVFGAEEVDEQGHHEEDGDDGGQHASYDDTG
jgi:hypothetical protein